MQQDSIFLIVCLGIHTFLRPRTLNIISQIITTSKIELITIKAGMTVTYQETRFQYCVKKNNNNLQKKICAHIEIIILLTTAEWFIICLR